MNSYRIGFHNNVAPVAATAVCTSKWSWISNNVAPLAALNECTPRQFGSMLLCGVIVLVSYFDDDHCYYIGASTDAYGHTTLSAPVLVRSPKLSSVGPAQYLDG